MNTFKTFVLLAALSALFLVIGHAIGGRMGLLIAIGFALVMNFGSYWFSDKLVLKFFKARPVDSNDNSGLYQMVKSLAVKAGLPMPKVYIVDSDAPNAFATGRNPKHAAVAATTGIIKSLTEEELRGVMAHELSHVSHHDTLIGAVSATAASAISTLANMAMWGGMLFGGNRNGEGGGSMIGTIAMAILAPMAAGMIQMAISRSREYAADEAGARLCRNPHALASALLKIQDAAKSKVFHKAETHPTTAHLFIINPLHGKKLAHLFSTHPPTEERVKRLREMVV